MGVFDARRRLLGLGGEVSFRALDEYLSLPVPEVPWWIEGLAPIDGLLLLTGSPKSGKAVPLDTPIITPDGWRTMADIQPGDWVIGKQGWPIRVLAVSPIQTGHACYRVTFDDRESVVCDAAHEWTVRTRSVNPAMTMTTQELVTRGIWSDGGGRYPRAKWQVDLLAAPIQFTPSREPLPIPPYTLGAWLGDGDTRAGGITSADLDVIRRVMFDGFRAHPYTIKYRYSILGLQTKLKALGVFGNKHIPEVYLRASVQDRWALLAGLLDTDGCAEKSGAVFYNTNARLAREVYELAVQLGCKVSLRTKRARLNGKDYGVCYCVRIRSSKNPFWLKRKADKFVANTEQFRTIQKIEPVPSVPVKCLYADAADHLYLVGVNCVPTHNTQLALTMATGLLSGWESVCGCPIIHRPKRIAFLQADTPRSTWHARLRVLTETHHLKTGLYVADSLDMPFPFDVRNLLDGGGYQWLAGALNRIQPDILIVDTYRTIHLGDENDGQDANRVLGALRQANNHKSLWILHHLRKVLDLSGVGDPINDIRGSSVMIGAADIIGQLKLGNEEPDGTRHGHLSLIGRNIPAKAHKVWMEGTDPFLLYPVEDTMAAELSTTQDIIAANPGVSQRELARRVATVLQCSEATARRRVAAVIGRT